MFLRFLRILLELAFWAVAGLVAMFVFALVLAMLLGPAMASLSPAAVILMLPLVAKVMRVVRRRRGLMALSYVEQAVRLNLPLPRMLWAAQRSEGGKLGERLNRLRLYLEQGYPIAAALDAAVPEVPRGAIAKVASAERVGRLPQALARLVEEERKRTGTDVSTNIFYQAYPVIMLLIIVGVLGMIMVFIIPKFEQIFRDFEIRLPPLTEFVIDVASAAGPPMLVLAVAMALWYLGRAFWEMVHPSAFRGWGPVMALIDRAVWYLPVAHGVARDRGLADVCEALGDALEVGAPADRAILHASELRVNRVLQDRVRAWGQLVFGGQPLADAARQAKLPRLLHGMLATARGPRDAADVLAFLARYYRGRFSRTAALLEGALVPIIVLFFGVIVCAVALSMFLPMVRLADQVMISTGLM